MSEEDCTREREKRGRGRKRKNEGEQKREGKESMRERKVGENKGEKD